MKVRSKAPLRLGLAGGGTDLNNYSNNYGGVVLNVTINLYVHCTIEKLDSDYIEMVSDDLNIVEKRDFYSKKNTDSRLPLHWGVYYKLREKYSNRINTGMRITTNCDAPAGSGLGTSSSVVVAIIKAFLELINIQMAEYDVARLAYEIERIDLKLEGGKQDQYASTFGGFNFIEFYNENRVIVNPLRIRKWIKNELQESIVLYFTGISRKSNEIIKEQIKNKKTNIKYMHIIKKTAYDMKEALLKGDIEGIIDQLRIGWEAKKKISKVITNNYIEDIYKTALRSGAKGGKISGAGGGGFMILFVDPLNKSKVIKSLRNYDGEVHQVQFEEKGALSWYIENYNEKK